MESLEQLVKLASLGTAGVCVLSVFIGGTIIFRLPDTSPPWKVSLMKQFLYFCVIIALVSALSGGANAYFNQQKIAAAESNLSVARTAWAKETQKVAEAESNLTAARTAYAREIQRVAQQNAKLNSVLASLKQELRSNNVQNTAVWSTVENVQQGIATQALTPEDKIFEIK